MSESGSRSARIGVAIALGALLIGQDGARAADAPGYYEPPPPGTAIPASIPLRTPRSLWEGIILGATVGYSNLNSNFEDSTDPLGGNISTSSRQYGGFIGYNSDWDGLILGVEAAYNRPSALTGGSTTGLSTVKLTDESTVRLRAGYSYGQFLPYGFFGGALARIDYSTPGVSRSNVFAYGAAAGLGVDVSVLPNVFLRAEWEYNYFAPVGGIGTSTNTGRIGVGLRF